MIGDRIAVTKHQSQLLDYYNAYEIGMQKALSTPVRLISIVESFHRSNPIPNQHFAELVVRVILNNVKEKNEVKMIKIVSMNHMKVRGVIGI